MPGWLGRKTVLWHYLAHYTSCYSSTTALKLPRVKQNPPCLSPWIKSTVPAPRDEPDPPGTALVQYASRQRGPAQPKGAIAETKKKSGYPLAERGQLGRRSYPRTHNEGAHMGGSTAKPGLFFFFFTAYTYRYDSLSLWPARV